MAAFPKVLIILLHLEMVHILASPVTEGTAWVSKSAGPNDCLVSPCQRKSAEVPDCALLHFM